MEVMLDEGAFMPERAHETDAGADIRTPVDVVVPAHGFAFVDTGVHMAALLWLLATAALVLVGW